ncbi:hypothetical protein ACFYW1_36530 [Streptomyces sp. NPDC002669]|uniref:hypothetical protein n=1 Tax=Streptomyces sp. NPDC002669 TaxID=3364658 RepID=UPI00367F6A7E
MADMSLDAALWHRLDAVPWDRLESALPQHPVAEVPRTLRRLARAGGAATEEDCSPLFSCLVTENGRVIPAATAALPFVVALAADPGMGARGTLVELLECLHRAATNGSRPADEEGSDEEWSAAWRRQRDAIRALRADPDPVVRRAALPLVAGVAPLLERWRTETDPAVRLPVLLELGEAAATAGRKTAAPGEATTTDGGPADEGAAEAGAAEHATAGSRTDPVEEVRAVLADVLRDGEPVMKVAALHAWACLDRDVPVRRADALVEVFTDAGSRSRFAEIWWVQGVDDPFSREDVIRWTGRLFDHVPQAAAEFVVRLAGAADRTGDTVLRRAVLDEAWQLLVRRPSAASALLPVAGGLLADPDDTVRLKAASLLAVLGRRAAPYADRLARLVDDPAEDDHTYIEGTVGAYARWALARIGDTRALPGLVEQLYEPYREHYSRGYCGDEPRLPDIDDVLVPLRAHADVLLPPLRERMRHHAAHCGGHGPLTGAFLRVLEGWGRDALPALPEVLPLLGDPRGSWAATDVLVAMGPAAARAEPVLCERVHPDRPAGDWRAAWVAWRLGGDATSALRVIGGAVLDGKGPSDGPVHLLADFGAAAAPYADRVRHIMENTDGWRRTQAALALWAATGEPEPSVPVLEEFVLAVAAGDDGYGAFGDALRALIRIGTVTPAARAALRTIRERDGRLSPYWDYRAFLQDEELRAVIEDALALP